MTTTSTDDEHSNRLRLFLLGGFRAERAGRDIPESAWQRRSGKSLVKILATEPSHRLHREKVQELLWPELDEGSSARGFRKALHFARRAFQPELPSRAESAYVLLHGDIVSLSSDWVWIDADHFQSLAKRATTCDDVGVLEAALAAYGGQLLPEDLFEEWSIARRDALAELRLTLLLKLAEVTEKRGNLALAIERLQLVLEQDPAREEAHRQLMRLHALRGSRHQALRQYQLCRARLTKELDAEPGPLTRALYRDIRAGRLGPGAVGGNPHTAGTVPLPAALRRQPTTPLFGRDQALELVGNALSRAATGAGGTVLVGGEAGIGKTRFAAEAARAAAARGGVVLWGAGREPGGGVPYGPFVEAVDEYLTARPLAERHAVAKTFPVLVSLVPSLAPKPGVLAEPRSSHFGQESRTESDPARLFTAIIRLLDVFARDRSLLLVLDDLHAGDAATLQLLGQLIPAAAARRWLLLGTYREEEVRPGSILRQLAAAMTRDGLCRRIDLPRLERRECDELVQALLPDGAVDPWLLEQIYVQSSGNPLFAQELVSAARERGSLTIVEGRWRASASELLPTPRQVCELVEARVDRLGEDVRRALAAAAAAGPESSFSLLRAVVDLPDRQLLDALDQALAARILEERGTGYAFRHPVLRAALYERLSHHRRAHLHAAVARAIEQQFDATNPERPDIIEALAHHWEQAGEPGRALPYLVRTAERRAEVYANTAAIERFRHALVLLDAMPPTAEAQAFRPAILERLGDLHALTGDSQSAREAYANAREAGAGEPLTEIRVLRKAAHQALLAGDLATATSLTEQAAARLGEAQPSEARDLELLRLQAVVAHQHWLADRFPEALAAAAESARLAEALGADVDLAQAYEMLALACLPLGEWRRGAEYERLRASRVDLNRDVAEAADVHL